MPKPTINSSKEFLQILNKCCENGKLDDEKLNSILSNFFPYDLVFKRRDE